MPRRKKGALVVAFPEVAGASKSEATFTLRILRAALSRCYDDGILVQNTPKAREAGSEAAAIESMYQGAIERHPSKPLFDDERRALSSALTRLVVIIDPRHEYFDNFMEFLNYGSEVVEQQEKAVETARQTQDELRRTETSQRTVENIIDEFFRFLLPEAVEECRRRSVVVADLNNRLEFRLHQIRDFLKLQLRDQSLLYNSVTDEQDRNLTFLLEDIRNVCVDSASSQTERMPEANLRLFIRRVKELILPAESRLPAEAEPEKVIRPDFSKARKPK